MISIILAAGSGNRMKPLTDACHKTLLKVAGKEILTRIIEGVQNNGITRIVLVTGYRADEVEGFVAAKFPEVKFTFVRNERFLETNNIYSMALAFEQIEIDEDVILIESDLICEERIFSRVIHSPHRNVALVDRYRTGMDGTVVAIHEGVVTSVIPPHQQGPKFDFSDKYKTLNIYKFDRTFCATTFKRLLTYYAKVIDSNCYYELILGMLIYMQQETIHAEIIDSERWAEVDDPNDLRGAEFVFNVDQKFPEIDKAFGGFWNYDILDFGFIRNMYFPTPSMYSEMRNSLEEILQSYSSNHRILREKLSWFLQCREERLNVLGGGCQAFPILRDFLAARRTWIPRPTFGEYARFGASAMHYEENGGDYISELMRRVLAEDAVIFVNPNNPTGTALAGRSIFDFAKHRPKNIVVVDESFIDFATGESVQQCLEAEPLDNVVIVKSLSKSLGVPGARLGYTYSSNVQFNAAMSQHLPIWQVGSIAEFLLEICLKHRRDLATSFADTRRDRKNFSAQLAGLSGIQRVYPSGGNFLLAQLGAPAEMAAQLCRRLMTDRNIYVKNVSSKFLDGAGYLRIAVRLPRENSMLCGAIDEIVKQPLAPKTSDRC